MLFRPIGTSKLQRIQGAFLTEAEIARITGHWAKQGEPEFDPALLEDASAESVEPGDGEFSPDEDDLLEDAARIVVESGTASVSMIQRRLRVGYTRAGRLIDMLERRGIISGYEGSKPRQVLVSMADLQRALGGEDGRAAAAPRGCRHARAVKIVRVNVRAGIVVTGTEVITGTITDRNGPWISKAPRRAGGRGRAHPRGRRPARRPRGGAALPRVGRGWT